MFVEAAGRWLETARREVVATVAPRRCAGCDATDRDLAICASCVTALARLPQPDAVMRHGSMVRSAFAYSEPLRSIIHRAKWGDARSALTVVAHLAALRLEVRGFALPDVVVPVPLASGRLRERGYNQAAVLADAVAARLGVTCSQALVRCRETSTQVGSDEAVRHANVAGAFAASQPVGGTVWLIDDVHTTGATTEAATAALLLGGASRVDIAVAARVL